MSEFESNPEAKLRAELSGLETNLININNKFATIQDGEYSKKRTEEEQKKLMTLATFTKRRLFEVLTQLGDIQNIKDRLSTEATDAIELFEEMGLGVPIDYVLEEVFATELNSINDEKVLKAIGEITEEYGLETSEGSGDETE